ncbi:hypothetical protein MMC19_002604 [Ptychographa xylographoides]|nr:hypothetical protein [Ptychographa xylographoides]
MAETGTALALRSANPLTIIDVCVPGTNRERRSFDFFRAQTGKELSTALNTPFWSRSILQASHIDPIIRHAAVALGALGERFLINDVLTSENHDANNCHVFASSQYQKSMEILRKHLCERQDRTIELVLMSCFLFVCFEFLQGNEKAAMTHMKSGVNIVRGFYSDNVTLEKHFQSNPLSQTDLLELAQRPRANGPRFSPYLASNSREDEIIRVFAILDIQAALWLGLNTYQAAEIAPFSLQGLTPWKYDNFTSLDEAGHSINTQVGIMLYLRRSLPPPEQLIPTNPVSHVAHQQRGKYLERLRKWPVAMIVLILELRQALTFEDWLRIRVMTLAHQCTYIHLFVALQDNEEQLYSGFLPVFRLLVSVAATLLRPANRMMTHKVTLVARTFAPAKDPMPLFTFTAGLIQSLHFTAVKCRDRDVAREAIALLVERPWREGAWDSAALAAIAERKIQSLEAEGALDEGRRMETPDVLAANDFLLKHCPLKLDPFAGQNNDDFVVTFDGKKPL